jgi:hypothetical protein
LTNKAFCIHGHELTPENVYTDPTNGKRQCRTCRKQRSKKHSQQRAAELQADRVARYIAGYWCWQSMIQRCTNPKRPGYHRYGGLGVTVCDRWRYGENGKTGFECFLEDMGPRPSLKHTISRHGDEGNYEPGNCEWSDNNNEPIPTEQHGTIAMYRRGCRCQPCCETNSEYDRQRRAKKKAERIMIREAI